MDIEDAVLEEDNAGAARLQQHQRRGRMAAMASARSQSFHAFGTAAASARQQQPQPVDAQQKVGAGKFRLSTAVFAPVGVRRAVSSPPFGDPSIYVPQLFIS